MVTLVTCTSEPAVGMLTKSGVSRVCDKEGSTDLAWQRVGVGRAGVHS